MSPPPVRIKIGGEIESSLSRSLATANSMIQKAEKDSQRAKKATTSAAEQEARKQLRAQEQLTKASEALGRQRSKALFDQYRAQETGAQRAAKAQEQAAARAHAAERREIDKTVRMAQRGFEEEARARSRSLDRFATRTSHRATRFLMPEAPIGSMVMRGLGDVARGVGIDASISSLIGRGVGIESAATALSNRGHIAGTIGPNGQVVSSSALQAEARAAGKATAVNPEELLAAGRAFVGLTGDLDLWRKIMPMVAKQTAALGGNQEEAAKAAGEFAAHVGDVPDKEKKIMDLMAVAAGQGKIGGVDFSDFAKYAAKAAAPAAQFQGDKVKNISSLTALAEIAKMHGGASSAAEAFTAIASLTTTLKKPARFKSIQGLLGNETGQFADREHTILRDPIELIRAMVVAASRGNKDGKSSLDKLAAAVGDARSLKAVSGLQNTFNEAGGGMKGLEAMNAELAKFKGAVMTEDETTRALAEKLKTSQSQAELFNQSLEAVTHEAMVGLTPALQNLKEPALTAAKGLGSLATWAAKNPGEAVMSAIGVSIARAGIESTLRSGIENAIKAAAGGLAGKGFGGGLGVAGNLSAMFAIATVSVATFTAGKLIIDSAIADKEKGQREAALAEANSAGSQAEMAQRLREGKSTPEDEKAAAAREDALKRRIGLATWTKDMDKANGGAPTGVTAGLENLLNPEKSAARLDAAHLDELKAEMARVHELLTAIKGGVLKVEVTNQPDGAPMPAGDNSGTGHRVSN